jgi:hypothetical protein
MLEAAAQRMNLGRVIQESRKARLRGPDGARSFALSLTSSGIGSVRDEAELPQFPEAKSRSGPFAALNPASKKDDGLDLEAISSRAKIYPRSQLPQTLT